MGNYITLYRKDFKKPGEGIDFFDDVLDGLGINDEDIQKQIEEIEIKVDGIVNIFDKDGNNIL